MFDFQVNDHPLPDFIPRNLFSDLSLPESAYSLPQQKTMRAGRKLTNHSSTPATCTWKRTTRRFAFERGALCHWVGIDVDAEEQSMSIDTVASIMKH